MYGDDCALLPAALHGGPEEQLGQVSYLCDNEPDSSNWQHERLSNGKEPGSRGTKKAKILSRGVWCIEIHKRHFSLGHALFPKVRCEVLAGWFS